MADPFHPGERAMQERTGMRERLAEIGDRVIRDAMPEQHRLFFAELPFVVVGSVDAGGARWASILVGAPGFVRAPDARTLAIASRPGAGDPLAASLVLGARLGVLGIQLETRRRNRANGRVAAAGEDGFAIAVEQSFGNCPQYIHVRHGANVTPPPSAEPRRESARLSAEALALVGAADTFFIATAAPGEGADVSHRGGPPGFVRVTHEADGTVLTFPDYRGNFYFNTLGNLQLDARAGITFVDFADGRVLMLTGRTDVIFDGEEVASFLGAQRLVRFTVEAGTWPAARSRPSSRASGGTRVVGNGAAFPRTP